MGSIDNKEVETEILPLIRVYTDGSVERLRGSPYVPPLLDDQQTGVSSKDITISQNPFIQARVFLPKLDDDSPQQKLPILVYYHGGGFCFESAFSADHHRYLSRLAAQGRVVAVSVEYRLAPEHKLPVAYEDCWAALHWVVSHFTDDHISDEPWLTNHGNRDRLFLGGDSAGANIAHNIGMRAGSEGLPGGVKVLGISVTHPYFWSSNEDPEKDLQSRVWNLVYPSAPGGIDNFMINPFGLEAPTLAGLGCSRLFVSVAEKDDLRNIGIAYYEAVKISGWEGEAVLEQVEREEHAFQILYPETQSAKDLTRKVADFLLT